MLHEYDSSVLHVSFSVSMARENRKDIYMNGAFPVPF